MEALVMGYCNALPAEDGAHLFCVQWHLRDRITYHATSMHFGGPTHQARPPNIFDRLSRGGVQAVT